MFENKIVANTKCRESREKIIATFSSRDFFIPRDFLPLKYSINKIMKCNIWISNTSYLTIPKFRAVFVFAVLIFAHPMHRQCNSSFLAYYFPLLRENRLFRAVLIFAHLFCAKISATRNLGIVRYMFEYNSISFHDNQL